MNASREMPRYKCHKEVWALKIKTVDRLVPNREEWDQSHAAILTPEEEGYAPFGVSSDYLSRHDPQPGGYFVVYKDDYQSFSPAGAFEEDYTRLE